MLSGFGQPTVARMSQAALRTAFVASMNEQSGQSDLDFQQGNKTAEPGKGNFSERKGSNITEVRLQLTKTAMNNGHVDLSSLAQAQRTERNNPHVQDFSSRRTGRLQKS